MSKSSIYLDHAATTPVREEVLEAMLPWFSSNYGNPSSAHRLGREARVALDEARERVASCLGANADECCFTSCGTEGDNFALMGAWRSSNSKGRTAVLSTPIEHKAVLAACHQIAKEGGEELLVPVNKDGVVDSDAFSSSCNERLSIASVMWVNNETGVVQNIPALTEMAKQSGALMHTDAVQAFGKIPFNLHSLPVDLMTISGHKIGAPKGIGALFIRRGTTLEPLLHGGSQDRGRRPGTENVPYAIALAKACELTITEMEEDTKILRQMQERFEGRIKAEIPNAVIHGYDAKRAPHITNVSIPGVNAETMLMALDLRGIHASGGSACQSGSVGMSHVLQAMNVPLDIAGAAIRFSLGMLTDQEKLDRAADVFITLAKKARGEVVT